MSTTFRTIDGKLLLLFATNQNVTIALRNTVEQPNHLTSVLALRHTDTSSPLSYTEPIRPMNI